MSYIITSQEVSFYSATVQLSLKLQPVWASVLKEVTCLGLFQIFYSSMLWGKMTVYIL